MIDLQNKNVLVTAGPTYEAIDPVRFIGNHSTGKMGIALCESAHKFGAKVTLVCGPSSIISSKNIQRIDVVSAQDMFEAVLKIWDRFDIIILTAAVADYRPKEVALEKIKKTGDMTIELERTPDILATIGAKKMPSQLLVGFALETNNEIENARNKCKKKNCDFIVLNSLKNEGAGFGTDTNKILILDKHNNNISFELKPKSEVAEDILQTICS